MYFSCSSRFSLFSSPCCYAGHARSSHFFQHGIWSVQFNWHSLCCLVLPRSCLHPRISVTHISCSLLSAYASVWCLAVLQFNLASHLLIDSILLCLSLALRNSTRFVFSKSLAYCFTLLTLLSKPCTNRLWASSELTMPTDTLKRIHQDAIESNGSDSGSQDEGVKRQDKKKSNKSKAIPEVTQPIILCHYSNRCCNTIPNQLMKLLKRN